jgi:hypothetical protein
VEDASSVWGGSTLQVADVRLAVGAVPGVALETPVDVNRFGVRLQTRVFDWLAEVN